MSKLMDLVLLRLNDELDHAIMDLRWNPTTPEPQDPETLEKTVMDLLQAVRVLQGLELSFDVLDSLSNPDVAMSVRTALKQFVEEME